MKLLEAAAGCMVALALPLHLSRKRLPRLLADPPAGLGAANDSRVALQFGLVTLRLLSRLRLRFWKNTCLFRSILRCLLLRRAGRPAVLKIGTRRDGSTPLAMHAWVEVQGEPLPDEGAPFTPLVASGGRA